MERSKEVNVILKTINRYEYIGTEDEKVSVTFKYLVELKNYVKALEQEVKNKEYKCSELEGKVNNLLMNQINKLNKSITHLV